MVRIKHDFKLEDSNIPRVDSVLNEFIIEYKVRVSDVRVVQSAIMMLAKSLEQHDNLSGILILDDPKISKGRLNDEWENWNKVFQQSIMLKLHMVVFFEGSIVGKFGDVTPIEIEFLNEIQKDQKEKSDKTRRRKPDSFFEVLRVLLIHWLHRSGPMQINQLSKQTGFSFPTIASVLQKLEPYLKRQTYRSVELKEFPREAWFRLLASMEKVRAPQGFFARNPRSVEYLIDRINETSNEDIAFGGFIGASHYFPDIDLVGIHRIDLSIHNWNKSDVNEYIRGLDPGLKSVKDGQLPQVVVHNLFRPEPFFIKSKNLTVADEVECLLDLHEARMEPQANELQEYLIRSKDI